jgi:hypothetical protein
VVVGWGWWWWWWWWGFRVVVDPSKILIIGKKTNASNLDMILIGHIWQVSLIHHVFLLDTIG